MAVISMDLESRFLPLEKPQPSLTAEELQVDDRPSSRAGSDGPPNSDSPLARLPLELLQDILSYLSAVDLARISATCRALAEHAANDLLWLNIINSYLPDPIHDTGPFDSFRSLYTAHHPCWFIPQKKIWFSDAEHTGNLILARYDHRRGVIEAYRIIAERRTEPLPGRLNSPLQLWEHNPEVIIQSFHPKTSLWLDDPVLLLKHPHSGRRYMKGDRMPMALESQHVFNSFSLCSNYIPYDLKETDQWPPPTIPTSNIVCRDVPGVATRTPDRLAFMSEYAFRIRRWAHFSAGIHDPMLTFATLDPELYTPTREKPYQGIWVGDYSAHGCEFLLIVQSDPEDEWSDSDDSNRSEHNSDVDHDSDSGLVHRGRLDAIKLTGDPNVPRGEVTFSSEDIGPGGFIRIAEESLFQGARIVHSRGHVAGIGFRDDTFIPSQLILYSPDCIAHYWDPMGHISYFRRLNIDELLRT